MSIKLGLQRIQKLIEYLPNPQLLTNLKIIHVGGTNGKGSLCSYLQSIVMSSSKQLDSKGNYLVGKYCSPHLIHPNDSITINNVPMNMDKYISYMNSLNVINSKHSINASSFEILTCVAFQWFYDNKVDFAIIEVGVGGENDATNIIPGESKVTVNLNKISLDHTNLLGSTVVEIATEKSGIIKPNVGKVFINGSNDKTVLDILVEKCKVESVPYEIVDVTDTKNWAGLEKKTMDSVHGYQKENLAMALANIKYLKKTEQLPNISNDDISRGISKMEWPGRLQKLDFQYTSEKSTPVLLDGAHNEDGANQLGEFLDTHYRKGLSTSLTFVLAMTEGKDISNILKHVLRPKDIVVITQFGKVIDMPWIQSMASEKIYSSVAKCVLDNHILIENNLQSAIPIAKFNKINDDQPIVVFGSLYLVGQLLQLHNSNLKK